MSGETSVGVDPTPPVDPVPHPASEAPGPATEEPELSDEADIPQEEQHENGPSERQPGSGPR